MRSGIATSHKERCCDDITFLPSFRDVLPPLLWIFSILWTPLIDNPCIVKCLPSFKANVCFQIGKTIRSIEPKHIHFGVSSFLFLKFLIYCLSTSHFLTPMEAYHLNIGFPFDIKNHEAFRIGINDEKCLINVEEKHQILFGHLP